MKKQFFDEYQRTIRYKIGFQTMGIALVLVLVNGIISSYYIWGTPLTQAFAILFASLLYFITGTVIKDVYLSNRITHPIISAIAFILIGLVAAVARYLILRNRGELKFIQNGQLTNDMTAIFMGVFFVYTGLLVAVKYLIDKKRADE